MKVYHNRHNINGMFVSGEEEGIAFLKRLDSNEADAMFRNVREGGEVPFETYQGVKFRICCNPDFTMVVMRADDKDTRWV